MSYLLNEGFELVIWDDPTTLRVLGAVVRSDDGPGPLCLECQGWTWPEWFYDRKLRDEGCIAIDRNPRSIRNQFKTGKVFVGNFDITSSTFASWVPRTPLDNEGDLTDARVGWAAVYAYGASTGRKQRERCAECRQSPSEALISGDISVLLQRPMAEATEHARPKTAPTDLTGQQLIEWWADRRGVVPPSWL